MFATSSSDQWKSEKSLYYERCNLSQQMVLPFTVEEARQYLKLNCVDEKWYDRIILNVGTVPLILMHFVRVKTEMDMIDSRSMLRGSLHHILKDLKFDKMDEVGVYDKKCIVQSMNWLSTTSNNCTISSLAMKEYSDSFLVKENLVFAVKKENARDWILPSVQAVPSMNATNLEVSKFW